MENPSDNPHRLDYVRVDPNTKRQLGFFGTIIDFLRLPLAILGFLFDTLFGIGFGIITIVSFFHDRPGPLIGVILIAPAILFSAMALTGFKRLRSWNRQPDIAQSSGEV